MLVLRFFKDLFHCLEIKFDAVCCLCSEKRLKSLADSVLKVLYVRSRRGVINSVIRKKRRIMTVAGLHVKSHSFGPFCILLISCWLHIEQVGHLKFFCCNLFWSPFVQAFC